MRFPRNLLYLIGCILLLLFLGRVIDFKNSSICGFFYECHPASASSGNRLVPIREEDRRKNPLEIGIIKPTQNYVPDRFWQINTKRDLLRFPVRDIRRNFDNSCVHKDNSLVEFQCPSFADCMNIPFRYCNLPFYDYPGKFNSNNDEAFYRNRPLYQGMIVDVRDGYATSDGVIFTGTEVIDYGACDFGSKKNIESNMKLITIPAALHLIINLEQTEYATLAITLPRYFSARSFISKHPEIPLLIHPQQKQHLEMLFRLLDIDLSQVTILYATGDAIIMANHLYVPTMPMCGTVSRSVMVNLRSFIHSRNDYQKTIPERVLVLGSEMCSPAPVKDAINKFLSKLSVVTLDNSVGIEDTLRVMRDATIVIGLSSARTLSRMIFMPENAVTIELTTNANTNYMYQSLASDMQHLVVKNVACYEGMRANEIVKIVQEAIKTRRSYRTMDRIHMIPMELRFNRTSYCTKSSTAVVESFYQPCPQLDPCALPQEYPGESDMNNAIALCRKLSIMDTPHVAKAANNPNVFGKIGPLEPNVFSLTNVFVSPEGWVFTKSHIYHSGTCGTETKFFAWADTSQHSLDVAINLFNIWGNDYYFFAITDFTRLASVIPLLEKYPTTTLILHPSQTKSLSWFALLGLNPTSLKVYYVENTIYIKQLIVPVSSDCSDPSPSALRMARKMMFSNNAISKLLGDSSHAAKKNVIYVHQRENLPEEQKIDDAFVASMLKGRFQQQFIEYFGNETIVQTAEMFSSAHLVIGASDTPLSYMILMPENSYVIEISNKITSHYPHLLLADSIGFQYFTLWHENGKVKQTSLLEILENIHV